MSAEVRSLENGGNGHSLQPEPGGASTVGVCLKLGPLDSDVHLAKSEPGAKLYPLVKRDSCRFSSGWKVVALGPATLTQAGGLKSYDLQGQKTPGLVIKVFSCR